MFAHALTQGGPRLVEGLPPTLQPNAILLAAPPADRRLSLLTACLVYTIVGSGLMVLARDRALVLVRPKERTVDVVFDQVPVKPGLPAPPKPEPVRTQGNGFRPPNAAILPQVAVPTAVPEETPTTLPTTDLRHAGQFTKDMAVQENGTGRVALVPAATPSTGAEAAPIAVDLKDVRVRFQVQPVYPGLARLARLQGPVELYLTVDALGVPTAVQVLSGPHPTLMAEALRVAKLWRFEPARVNGLPVPAQFRLTVVFRLS